MADERPFAERVRVVLRDKSQRIDGIATGNTAERPAQQKHMRAYDTMYVASTKCPATKRLRFIRDRFYRRPVRNAI